MIQNRPVALVRATGLLSIGLFGVIYCTLLFRFFVFYGCYMLFAKSFSFCFLFFYAVRKQVFCVLGARTASGRRNFKIGRTSGESCFLAVFFSQSPFGRYVRRLVLI